MVFLHFAYMLHIFLKKYFSFQNRKCQKCVTHWTKKRDIFYCTTKTVIFIIRMSHKKRISEAIAFFLLLVEFYFYGFHIISNIFSLCFEDLFFDNCLFLCLIFRYYALSRKTDFLWNWKNPHRCWPKRSFNECYLTKLLKVFDDCFTFWYLILDEC